ncbi:MAG: SDR family NAD(P)-dependent oxidoreductase [Calditrichaeota bacterium]|nr:SDR family NAD(P)-dependent oxidoreductase [Calditrichota bacterium]
MDFQNKLAVVTGGGGFLGTAVVRDLLESGAQVAVPLYHEEEGDRLRDALGSLEPNLLATVCDLSSEQATMAWFAGLGPRLDLLACIAGGFAWSPIEDSDASTLERMLSMNLHSVYNSVRAALPLFGAAGGGRIVTVGALPALNGGGANMSAYVASKGALLSLTRALAEELLPQSITVNAIVPTIIDTPTNRASMPDADTGKWLAPADIARVIHFLAGPDARLVTGSALSLAL